MVKIAVRFEWDTAKNLVNQRKHGVSFETAKSVFSDPALVVIEDATHSGAEQRYFGFGKIGGRVMTVRFTYRKGAVRIFGAAYWRKGAKIYAQENRI